VPKLNRIPATRVVAKAAALDSLEAGESLVLRFAPDEAWISPPLTDVSKLEAGDPHGIIIADSGYSGVWLAADEALSFLERNCEWDIPAKRPAFAQGAVAGVPAKLWLESERVLFLVPTPYATDFEERMS